MTSSFKNRLERLHGSRKRAQERQQEDEEHGVFSADEANEMETPPGEPPPEEADDGPDTSDDSSGGESNEPLDADEPDGAGNSEEQLDDLGDMTVRRAEPSARERRDDRDEENGNDTTGGAESEPERSQPEDNEHRETEVGERLARRYSLRDRSDADTSSESEQSTSTGRREADRSEESDRVSRETYHSEPPNERAERLRRRAAEHLDNDNWEAALPFLHEILALLPRHSFALQKLVDFHRDNGHRQLADHYESRLRKVAPF
jgi:hypothetical protein